MQCTCVMQATATTCSLNSPCNMVLALHVFCYSHTSYINAKSDGTADFFWGGVLANRNPSCFDEMPSCFDDILPIAPSPPPLPVGLTREDLLLLWQGKGAKLVRQYLEKNGGHPIFLFHYFLTCHPLNPEHLVNCQFLFFVDPRRNMFTNTEKHYLTPSTELCYY